MKTNFFRWTLAALAAASTASLVSCVYDPYYGGGYGYGNYDGYGYGGYGYGPTVQTSLIITSDNRWGYDRYRHCYYDYHRRAYYDPYLYGYYPIGYLPPIIYGAPHPYGWYPGRGVCPPPRHIRTGYISNYRNRVELLRQRDYSWARSAREDRMASPGVTRGPQESRRGDFNRFRDSRSENLPTFRENRDNTIERFRENRIENVERVRDLRQANLDRFRERHGDTHQRVIENRQANIDRFQSDRTTNFNRIADNRAAYAERGQSMRAQNATRQQARAEYRQERKETKNDEKENGRGYGR